MGESPLDNPKLKSVLAEINSKIGWKKIKEAVQEIVSTCETNYERQLTGDFVFYW